MSLEKAQQFVSRMKEDKNFRARVQSIPDMGEQRDYLMSEGLEFDQQELICAMAECMSELDKMMQVRK